MKRINLKLNVILLTILAMFAAMNSYSQQTREEIPAKYKWNLTDLYASDEAWRDAVESLTLKLDEIEQFKGTLTKSATNLLKVLEFNSELSKEASKIYLYAGMSSDLDTRDMKYNGMKQELQSLFSNFGAKAAFIQPEILAADWETIDGFLKEEPKLEIYRMGLENMFRTKAHTLSEAEERIMALSGMVSSVPQAVYGTFSNAEMPKPEVTLSDGSKIAIGSAEYGRYRASSNRADRKSVV